MVNQTNKYHFTSLNINMWLENVCMRKMTKTKISFTFFTFKNMFCIHGLRFIYFRSIEVKDFFKKKWKKREKNLTVQSFLKVNKVNIFYKHQTNIVAWKMGPFFLSNHGKLRNKRRSIIKALDFRAKCIISSWGQS